MNKIIVPLDFSDCSIEALKVAADIARKANAEVVMTHWFYRSIIGVGINVDAKQGEKYTQEVSKKMTALAESSYLKGTKTSQLIIKNKDVIDVLNSKELKEGELIVMGTSGASNLKEMMMGSNAQKVVRNAECPVLALKEYVSIDQITDVIFASDFSDQESVVAYKKLVPLFEFFNARVHLFKVITPSYFEDGKLSDEKMRSFRESAGVTDAISKIYNHYTPEEGITDYAQEYDNAIISIATKGLKGFLHFMSGSISEDLVNKLNKPILTIKL